MKLSGRNQTALGETATNATGKKTNPLTGGPSYESGGYGHVRTALQSMGNRAATRLLQRKLSAQGPVIQRALDDAEKVKWTDHKLSALWIKMRDRSEGSDGFPGYANAIPNGQGTVKSNLAQYIGQDHTERELAELIVNQAPFKAIFLNPRKQHAGDEIARPGGSVEEIIKKVLQATVFYHATPTANVGDIFAGGIKAKKGGKGAGISTLGRDDAAASATYNKWSKDHTFITKSLTEAKGYRDKMTGGGTPATIIHVFSSPSFIAGEMKVDIDSKAGLKYEGDLDMIGNGTSLNGRALSVIKTELSGIGVQTDTDTITRVYAATFA